MVAFIELTREEAQLVSQGSVFEPSYRPFPTSARGLAERYAEGIDDDGDEGDDDSRFPSGPSEALPDGPVFRRELAAESWKRSTVELAVLGRGIDSATGGSIIALARAESGPRSQHQGLRQVSIGPWFVLPEPIAIELLASRVAPRHATHLRRQVREMSRPFSPAVSTALSTELAKLIPGYAETADELSRRALPTRQVREDLESRDATATALSILSSRWRSLQPLQDNTPPAFALAVERDLTGATENDLITDDASLFPGWDRAARSSGGWWGFRHQDREMWIKNINVSTAETKTGADLVYVRTDPDAVVLVQYKRLKHDADGEPVLVHDARLPGQLERMLQYESDVSSPSQLADHRIGPEFAFVKFVDDQAQQGLEETELTRGRYLTARYVSHLLSTPPDGKRGGRSRYVGRGRSIEPSAFVSLVRGGWIGSRGEVTTLLRETLNAPSPHLILAVEQPSRAS